MTVTASLLFQFHKGSIKTLINYTSMQKSSNFNSIKVRLKLNGYREFSTPYQFQFHKGSIKTLKIVVKVLIYALFQFHKGSIKTGRSRQKVKAVFIFQFHKGSIKTVVPSVKEDVDLHFNSIKVRLKHLHINATEIYCHISIP